jgi:hypothetical protein
MRTCILRPHRITIAVILVDLAFAVFGDRILGVAVIVDSFRACKLNMRLLTF